MTAPMLWRCAECDQDLCEGDALHTWVDGISDCHETCCPECNATTHCTDCLNHYPAGLAHTCWPDVQAQR